MTDQPSTAPDLDVLFVISISRATQPQAGGIFALTGLGVQGVPEMRFRG